MTRGPVASRARLFACLLCLAFLPGSFSAAASPPPAERSSDRYIRQLDDLSALWSYYKQRYIIDGRVVSWDEQGITTSEGQGYALLRAVWSGDRATFDRVWTWTKTHLQTRPDKLFAWKWKDKVLSGNSATDADTDIALALILAARRFDRPAYEREALAILASIWDLELLHVEGHVYVAAGNWALHEEAPVIHVAYLAPYAYEVFSSVDPSHPWRQVIADSYALLHWLYDEERVAVPPEIVYWDKGGRRLSLRQPKNGQIAEFSYDAFPIFWRVAQDAAWFGRAEEPLRQAMLAFFEREWKAQGRFLDRYKIDGTPRSSFEGLPLYATVHALALDIDPDLARQIRARKLAALQRQALAGKATPYYLHNWLWFGEAAALQQTRHYDEFLGFLRPFDVSGFLAHFPLELFAAALALFFLARWHPVLTVAFLLCAAALCVRYLWWRLSYTLNFVEPGGLFISLSLWVAECYAFSTVLLLVVQVGIRSRQRPPATAAAPAGFAPSVDVFIPIYSESCAILERTLIAASAMAYEPKRLYVLDDSHREDVRELALRYGAHYLKGPRRHAKAGNLNQALTQTGGELVVVFDTDHLPVATFLRETVPFFADPRVGFVQTPHHFYNRDIFQRALHASPGIPNEQDMFNHAIQGGRESWGGSFFVGSGAVFRRAAIVELGGFKLMSITEDIHTSQHLHARGWRSVFLDKDLAVGLTAETLGSYLVQRRRWMLGCLQIFFKDNPLLCRGLSLRHRLGYFASLYYFFFPAARVVFWITPLYFLLFHLHPIFSDVSVLVAYLLPFLLLLPMMSSTLLPGWPRLLWSTVYETTVCFPLFRSMFDLFLPKRLGFSVTPKGLVSHRRTFDWRSSWSLVVATAVTLAAMAKGLWEFWYFGIEKDAYFFNLSWAGINLVGLLAGLLMAWERPQRRAEERIRKSIPFRLEGQGRSFEGRTDDVSAAGCSFTTKTTAALPSDVSMTFLTDPPFTCRAQVVYHERLSQTGARCGLRWIGMDQDTHRRMVLAIFADPATWAGAHAGRVKQSVIMAAHLLIGLVTGLAPSRRRRRRTPRHRTIRRTTIVAGAVQRPAVIRDYSARGIGLIVTGPPLPADQPWTVTHPDGSAASYTVCYRTRLAPSLWRYGARPSVPAAEAPPVHATTITEQT
jgi:cellulose synthase (UDP-forming)